MPRRNPYLRAYAAALNLRLLRPLLPATLLLPAALLLSGCGMPPVTAAGPLPTPPRGTPAVTSVVPSANGTPNVVKTWGNYAFVSVQGNPGQIFTYTLSTGTPVPAGTPYTTTCSMPGGMQMVTVGAQTVMAVTCYDTNSLLTLALSPTGQLSALGSVGGLPRPFPGVALDGTDLYIPLFGVQNSSDGGVAKVSLANPAQPSITATTTLPGPASGGFVNPGALTVSAGNVYVLAGSESAPGATSSSIDVLAETNLALVGTPFVVDHSPQQIAISQGVAFVTFYDAGELQSIDISNPASLKSLQQLVINNAGAGCSALPVTVFELFAYVGCYGQGTLLQFNISDPTNMTLAAAQSGITQPQTLSYSSLRYLLVASSATGGPLYQIDGGRF